MRFLPFAGCVLILCTSGCQGWSVQPVSPDAVTPVPSRTPVIDSPTPYIEAPTDTLTPTASLTPAVATSTASAVLQSEPSVTPTPGSRLGAKILACDTGVDLAHGMGQVTNAYITITNAGGADAPNVCATLSGFHEGRPHPDKAQCLADVPAGYQVTLKLTIDTTADESTAIQVEIKSGGSLLLRLGASACPGPVLVPDPFGSLKTPQPIP